ncbi:MAG: DNA-directed RNA polymerase subunit E [Euryarchaeota archaeon]|nr:DNA-directed RNA polymerase subunit E [Euryarchaeota archaeon]
MKACKNCHRLTEAPICQICQMPTSKTWQGYVVVSDPERSMIAHRMNITKKGKYALKVR